MQMQHSRAALSSASRFAFASCVPWLQREVAREASRVTRYVPWLVTREGVLRIRDQHVDVASRLVFPPVYGIAVLAFYSSIWGTHRP